MYFCFQHPWLRAESLSAIPSSDSMVRVITVPSFSLCSTFTGKYRKRGAHQKVVSRLLSLRRRRILTVDTVPIAVFSLSSPIALRW